MALGLLLWNVFENRKRTFSVFKTDRQPYGLGNGPFSGEIFLFSFSGRPPLENGAPFSINIVIETGAWIWSRHGFPHIVRGNKRSNVPKTTGQAAPAWRAAVAAGRRHSVLCFSHKLIGKRAPHRELQLQQYHHVRRPYSSRAAFHKKYSVLHRCTSPKL